MDCFNCDCWDSDREGCTMPEGCKEFACPLNSNLKGAPGIHIDDFASFFYDIALNLVDIGNLFGNTEEPENFDDLEKLECELEKALCEKIISIGESLYSFVSSVYFYRVYLIKCILSNGGCGYTEGELLRFSVGILENIFVLNHCHDVDYLEVIRYNEDLANDLKL